MTTPKRPVFFKYVKTIPDEFFADWDQVVADALEADWPETDEL